VKEWLKRVTFMAALVGLGYWGWTLVYQSPERAIRKRVEALAREASFGPNQGLMSEAWKATSLTAFFTTNVQVTIDVPGGQNIITGLDELQTAVLYTRHTFKSLEVHLPDIKVTLDPGGDAAAVNLTARGEVIHADGQQEDYLQELRLRLIKVKRDWLIKEIVTVRTLS
jgi:hypothetical protein